MQPDAMGHPRPNAWCCRGLADAVHLVVVALIQIKALPVIQVVNCVP
jgi:hypothetical protein